MGALSTLIYVGGVHVTTTTGFLSAVSASVLFYVLGTLANYVLHYYWSFSADVPHRQATLRFLAVIAAGITTNAIFVWVASPAITATGAAIVFSVAWPVLSYLVLRYWVMANRNG